MKRWLTMLLLLGASNGCMMMDEWLDEDVHAPRQHAIAERPGGTCGAPPPVATSQTAEPELLQARK